MRPSRSSSVRRALIYALGGGLGHRTRGGALAEALAVRGVDTTLLVPGEAVGSRGVSASSPKTWAIAPTADANALRRAVEAAIRDTAPDLLVVDALPAGVLGELDPLPRVSRTAVLLRLHRNVDRIRSVVSQYDLQLDLEPSLRWWEGGQDMGPVVSRPARGLREVDVALVASDAGLAALFRRLAPMLEGAGRSVRLHRAEPLDVSSARLVVGAAGYNLTWECAAAGVHHLAVPRARRFDDQFRRASLVAERPPSPEALLQRAVALTAPDAPTRMGHSALGPLELADRLLARC